jgi:hypothetical protein
MADPRRMTPEEHGEAHALLVRAVTDPDWHAASQALDDLMGQAGGDASAAGGRGTPPSAHAAT